MLKIRIAIVIDMESGEVDMETQIATDSQGTEPQEAAAFITEKVAEAVRDASLAAKIAMVVKNAVLHMDFDPDPEEMNRIRAITLTHPDGGA